VSDVIKLYPAADPDEVLRQAIGQYDSVVVMGWNKDGAFSGRSSLNIEVAEILLLVEIFKVAILSEIVE
jgi:hypothetical protein